MDSSLPLPGWAKPSRPHPPCTGTSRWAQACQQEGPSPRVAVQLYLAALGIVWKIALAGKSSGGEWLPGVGVLRALQEEHRTGVGCSERYMGHLSALPLHPPGQCYSCTQVIE